MKNDKLSTRVFSEIFWKTIFGNIDSDCEKRNNLLKDINSLETLRENAEYNTGSISFADS